MLQARRDRRAVVVVNRCRGAGMCFGKLLERACRGMRVGNGFLGLLSRVPCASALRKKARGGHPRVDRSDGVKGASGTAAGWRMDGVSSTTMTVL